MVVVNKLNNGSFSVYCKLTQVVIVFTSETLKGGKTFQCNQASFIFSFNYSLESSSIDFTLEVSYEEPEAPPKLPETVTIFMDGQAEEMTKITDRKWGNVNFNCPAVCDKCPPSSHNLKCLTNSLPVVHMKIDFETPPSLGERNVLNHLSKLFESQKMADILFLVKGQEIGAHTAIIASAGHTLAAMLDPQRSRCKVLESKSNIGYRKLIEVDDTDPRVFHEMLRYVYTGIADLEPESMLEPLFLAADRYQIESLKELCVEKMITNLKASNGVCYLVLAYVHTAPKLLESSINYLVEHKKDMWNRPEWKDLMKNFPDLFFLASHRMIG